MALRLSVSTVLRAYLSEIEVKSSRGLVAAPDTKLALCV
jgi:hypothetical protein